MCIVLRTGFKLVGVVRTDQLVDEVIEHAVCICRLRMFDIDVGYVDETHSTTPSTFCPKPQPLNVIYKKLGCVNAVVVPSGPETINRDDERVSSIFGVNVWGKCLISTTSGDTEIQRGHAFVDRNRTEIEKTGAELIPCYLYCKEVPFCHRRVLVY